MTTKVRERTMTTKWKDEGIIMMARLAYSYRSWIHRVRYRRCQVSRFTPYRERWRRHLMTFLAQYGDTIFSSAMSLEHFPLSLRGLALHIIVTVHTWLGCISQQVLQNSYTPQPVHLDAMIWNKKRAQRSSFIILLGTKSYNRWPHTWILTALSPPTLCPFNCFGITEDPYTFDEEIGSTIF